MMVDDIVATDSDCGDFDIQELPNEICYSDNQSSQSDTPKSSTVLDSDDEKFNKEEDIDKENEEGEEEFVLEMVNNKENDRI
jgi:hypothetical protein